MDKWHENLSALRQYLKGWSANINGMYKKKKEELMQRIQEIDNKAEGEDTGAEMWTQRMLLEGELEELMELRKYIGNNEGERNGS